MSGSIAAIAAYNSTGTQGHGTVDEYEKGVKSVFWNDYDTDKHFVNGCSVSEITSNKGTITTDETIVFTFDNDIDAISDLYLYIEAKNVNLSNSTDNTNLPIWFLTFLVERVEICIGNQVISTINTAGLIKSYYDENERETLYRSKKPSRATVVSNNTFDYSGIFKLDIFNTLENDVDCSYLMGLANNQTLQVKVYPQNLTTSQFNSYTGRVLADGTGVGAAVGNEFNFKLFANKCIMTNAERNLLKNQVVPKRTNISQFATPTNIPYTTGLTLADNSQLPFTINCDHFNIYADALYVVAADITTSTVTNTGFIAGSQTGTNGTDEFIAGGAAAGQAVSLASFDVEVFLNSSSYSGILIPELMNNFSPRFALSDGTGNTRTTTRLDEELLIYYKIPLSNLAMSKDQDFVPLGKYDSIRVVLTPTRIINVSKSFTNTVSVIATGKTTGLYQNGAVTFSTF